MHTRIQQLFLLFLGMLLLIILRLSYWQVIKTGELSAQASNQYLSQDISNGARGTIITVDDYPLVVNQAIYTLGAYMPSVVDKPTTIVDQLMSHLVFTIDDPSITSDSAKLDLALETLKSSTKSELIDKLSQSGYSTLARSLSVKEKNEIYDLGIKGLTYDQSFTREYPEASMSAHLTGFVGRDDLGNPKGYFGLEGYYDRELTPRSRIERQEKDAGGNPLLIGDFQVLPGRNGRNLRLHLQRSTQFLVDTELARGIEQYEASSGEVIVMDPKTGGILAMASLPTYDPAKFNKFDTALYKNPSVANSYEPGSTFKVLVMAAAFNEGVVKESDQCDICSEPYQIGKYFIKTWNNEYKENASPEDIIVHSDNVGMVWTQQKLGGDKLLEYIKKFGFGSKTGIDMQEEVTPALRTKWGDIDYATSSFGQGIAVTSIQMVAAVGALANGGMLMEPHLVQSVEGESVIEVPPKEKGRVVSRESADRITELMIRAVEQGEAKWAAPRGYVLAGKTGTAQIAVEGHYDSEKTTVSFVGFAPAKNPKFVMLVKLSEPKTSQWAAETAAPLWFDIATKLLLHYNIAPSE